MAYTVRSRPCFHPPRHAHLSQNERAKIITQQALSLSPAEREELLFALAASLGKHPYAESDALDPELSDEAKQYLKDAWDKGVASGPGRYASMEDIIGKARRRLGDRAWGMRRVAPHSGSRRRPHKHLALYRAG